MQYQKFNIYYAIPEIKYQMLLMQFLMPAC